VKSKVKRLEKMEQGKEVLNEEIKRKKKSNKKSRVTCKNYQSKRNW